MAARLTSSGLHRFRDVALRHVADDNVPGLVALVACGDQVHAEALGSLSAGRPPVARDSLFRIASVTKPVVGAATLALVAEGLVGLDEPVDRLLPELAARRVLRRMYNTGASVLGVLLSRAAGQPCGEVLRTRIFEPLGMAGTEFWTT